MRLDDAPEPPAPEPEPGAGVAVPGRLPWLLALVAASAALLGALAWGPFVPTGDGPQHVMMGHIENHYEDADQLYQHFLEPATQFAGRGFSAVFVPLDGLLPWRSATFAAVALCLLAWAWGFALLVDAVEPRRRWLGLLGFGCAFQWSLYLGLYAFILGSAAGFLLLALCIRWERLGWQRLVVVGLWLFMQAIVHLFSAAVTGLALLVVVLARAPSIREALAGGGKLVLAALPAGSIFVLSMLDARHMADTIRDADKLLFLPLGPKLGYLPRCFQPGEGYRGWMVAALALGGVGRGLLAARRSRLALGLSIASLALLLAALFGPLNIPGWQLFFPRFLPLGVALAIALLDVEALPKPAQRTAAAGLAAAVTLASLLGAAQLGRRLHDRLDDALAGLDAPIERHGPRLAIVRDSWAALTPSHSPVPFLIPLRSLGALYVTQQGGIIPDMFVGSNPIHLFLWRRDHFGEFPPIPDLLGLQKVAHRPPASPERRAVLDSIATHGAHYEDVILYGDPADARALVERGYREDFREGDLWLGHFAGCKARIVIDPGQAPLSLHTLLYPGGQPAARVDISDLPEDDDGVRRATLSRLPCGDLLVSIDGAAADLRCMNATTGGFLRATLWPDGEPEIRCVR